MSRAPRTISIAVAAAAALCILIPAVGVVVSLLRLTGPETATTARPFSADSIVTTLIVCLTIAILATALALPAAWSLRGGGGGASARWSALVAVPLLMPTYLAYAGWGTLRAPGSWLGEFLSRGDPIRVIIADRVFAIAGLALWSWPIAAILIGAAARRLPQSLIDALALQPASQLRKAIVIAQLLAPSIAASIALIALITAGSAIPLHLAQVQTYAIHLWQYMSLTPEPVRVWLAAWPLLLLALAGATICIRLSDRTHTAVEDQGDPRSAACDRQSRAAAILLWCLSVPVPIALFAWSLHSPGSLLTFWRESGPAVAHSAANAAIVGAICGLLCLAAWSVRSVAVSVHRGHGAGTETTEKTTETPLSVTSVPSL